MLNILVQAFFFLISGVASLFVGPIVTLVQPLFPNFTEAIAGMLVWVQTSVTAIPFILKLLCVPLPAVSFYLLHWVAVFTVVIGVRGFLFFLNVFRTFKP